VPRAEPGVIVAVTVFDEYQQVRPVQVVLDDLRGAVDRPPPGESGTNDDTGRQDRSSAT
jgi:hypothetical protein